MTMENNPSLSEIMARVEQCLAREDRQDELFRMDLVTNEVGDWAKFLTHDPILNPSARPVGGKTEETMAAGQALIMLLSLFLSRKIDVSEALEVSLKNWEEADWRKKKTTANQRQNEIQGVTACDGIISGHAYVVSLEHPIEKVPARAILVVSSANPELALYFDRVAAVVTDHGGKTCHAASLARARNLPCVVGTGNATERIKHSSLVTVEADADTGVGLVHIDWEHWGA